MSALIGDDINEESDNEENFEPTETNGDHVSEDSDLESDADESKELSGVGQEQRGQKRKHETEEQDE